MSKHHQPSPSTYPTKGFKTLNFPGTLEATVKVEIPPEQCNRKTAKTNRRVAIKILQTEKHRQPVISDKTLVKIDSMATQSALLAALQKLFRPRGKWILKRSKRADSEPRLAQEAMPNSNMQRPRSRKRCETNWESELGRLLRLKRDGVWKTR